MLVFAFFFIFAAAAAAEVDNQVELETALAQAVESFKILNIASVSVNYTIQSMKHTELALLNATNAVLAANRERAAARMRQANEELALNITKKASNVSQAIKECLQEEKPLDILKEAIFDEIKNCITVGLMENVNIISSSINEAQTFMELPSQVAKDLERCSSPKDCLISISLHSVQESIQIPSKVLVLAARIQQMAYHSLGSIDGCALNGLVNLWKQGVGILEDIEFCVEEKLR